MKTGSVELTTPDGAHLSFRGSSTGPEAQLVIRDWSACAAILRSGDIGVAESYRDGKIETPDLLSVLMLALANQDIMEQTLHGSFWGTLLYRMRHLLRRNTRQGSRKNIHTHYDIGNSFYRLWLDPSMTYSAGIFASDATSLEASQYAKYDRILEALELRHGDHVLEIGCGWGAFAEYAATKTGCSVTGISLSREQLADCLQHYLGALPPAQQSALLLRDQSGLEFAEIAEALATTEANVRVLLHRARLKLLAVINRYEEEGEC